MDSWENIKDLHKSVLLQELVDWINIFSDKRNIIVDCTLGLWWHASEIIKRLNKWDIFIWFDADIKNMELAKLRLEKLNKNKDIELVFINSNFVNLKDELNKLNINEITWIYYDLWISSVHIDTPERWFSFKYDWPLDMRFDKSHWITASKVVNSYRKDDLIKVFRNYWEEPSSIKIAHKIIEKRKEKKFETTKELSDTIWEVSNFPKSKNRIFQAIRIEVNNELWNVKTSVEDAISILIKDWNIFVISFHSLEDRIIKRIFKKETRDCICTDLICSCKHIKSLKLLTKKPILPTEEEVSGNQRSRSAKARIARKI